MSPYQGKSQNSLLCGGLGGKGLMGVHGSWGEDLGRVNIVGDDKGCWQLEFFLVVFRKTPVMTDIFC